MKNKFSKALVTGSSKRIGKDIADHLEKSGLTVLRHTHKLPVPSPNFLYADFTVAGAVDGLVEKCQDVEILINNAAMFCKDTFFDFDPELLIAHYNVNVVAPLTLISHLPNLKAVVNILDASILHNEDRMLSYSLSKRTLMDSTKIAALALAKRGIRVNGIALGFALYNEDKPREIYEKLIDATPLKRETTQRELLAALDLALHSPSQTGSIIFLDSGASL